MKCSPSKTTTKVSSGPSFPRAMLGRCKILRRFLRGKKKRFTGIKNPGVASMADRRAESMNISVEQRHPVDKKQFLLKPLENWDRATEKQSFPPNIQCCATPARCSKCCNAQIFLNMQVEFSFLRFEPLFFGMKMPEKVTLKTVNLIFNFIVKSESSLLFFLILYQFRNI